MQTGKKIFLIMFIIGGLAFAAFGGYQYWTQQQAIQNSQAQTVTVESSEVDREVSRRDRDDDGIREKEVDYYARITYTYTYNGQSYQNNNVYPGAFDPSLSQSKAQSIVSNYTEGETATGYLNPENPEESYLVDETTIMQSLLFVGMGLLFALVGVLAVFKEGDKQESETIEDV